MQAHVLALALVAFVPAASDLAPRGRYVEARTASVFAGACHFGGEATTAGREALLAWHFEGGRREGVELAGLDAVAIVVGEANLAGTEPRHAVLYVSDRASATQRDAVKALIVERAGKSLGAIDSVRTAPITASFGAETYSVESAGLFALTGALLPDRACCKMPLQVWYEPFTALDHPIVGRDDEFRCSDKRVGRVWSRPGENASFSGAFRYDERAVAKPAAFSSKASSPSPSPSPSAGR
jgi:hypothetical protein